MMYLHSIPEGFEWWLCLKCNQRMLINPKDRDEDARWEGHAH